MSVRKSITQMDDDGNGERAMDLHLAKASTGCSVKVFRTFALLFFGLAALLMLASVSMAPAAKAGRVHLKTMNWPTAALLPTAPATMLPWTDSRPHRPILN